jgi:hypothetical protein
MRCDMLDGVGVQFAPVVAYMNPAPPVIIIFLTSGSGSYFVLPVKTGASFQTPKSSKNLFAAALEVAGQCSPKKFTYAR